MDLILDTHALVWLLLGDAKLGSAQRQLIENPENRIFVSAVSIYEIANKFRIGRMPDAGPILKLAEDNFSIFDWVLLPINMQHARLAGGLPSPHRDPFDRLLAAQSLTEKMSLMTRDAEFRVFGVETVW